MKKLHKFFFNLSECRFSLTTAGDFTIPLDVWVKEQKRMPVHEEKKGGERGNRAGLIDLVLICLLFLCF